MAHGGRRAIRARRGGLACFALGVALALFAAPAAAVDSGHIHDFHWGGEGTGAGQFGFSYAGWDLAIDQSTGDVYVADAGNSRVQKFDEDGNFLLMWGYGVRNGADEFQVCTAPESCQQGLYGNAPGQLRQPVSIAVDNSDGPNKGRVYVADANCWCGEGRNEILKYSPSGTYLGSINAEASPGGTFHGMGGDNLDVDGNGFLWVVDQERIMRFSNQTHNAYVGGSEWNIWIGEPFNVVQGFNIAVVPDGSAVYINSWNNEGGCCAIYRFPPSGSNQRVAMRSRGGSIAFDSSNGHFYVANLLPTINDCPTQSFEFDGDPIDPQPIGPAFRWEGFECGIAALAVNATTHTVYGIGINVPKIVAFKLRRVPLTITEPATGVAHTTATLHGQTAPDPNEGGDVSECYFEWGTTKTYDHQTPCEPGAPISGLEDVEASLSGLLQEGTYHYRLTTANGVDTEHGADHTFTTHAVIGVSTDDATEITPRSASLAGSFDPDGLDTEYFFEWGKTQKLGNTTPIINAGSDPGTTSVSVVLDGLEDYTTYHYRLAATNALGTSYGEKRTFQTTPPPPPTVTDSAVYEVTGSSARLSSVVTPNLGETLYGFEYGESTAYGAKAMGPDMLAADDEAHPVEVYATGLRLGRTYHFRALAINFGGITYGPDQTFATLDVPTVLSMGASGVSTSAATLSAHLLTGRSATTVRFEYGPTPFYGRSTGGLQVGDAGAPLTATAPISGLSPGTTYHYRAVAENALGSVAGADQTFATPPAATATPPNNTRKCRRGFVKRKGKCVKRRRSNQRRRGKAHGATGRGAEKRKAG